MPNSVKVLFEQCLDELSELSNVVVEEWSTPDVVQEYLQNIVSNYGFKLRKLERQQTQGVGKCPVRRPPGTRRP